MHKVELLIVDECQRGIGTGEDVVFHLFEAFLQLLPVLVEKDAGGLVSLPQRALGVLAQLKAEGRFGNRL